MLASVHSASVLGVDAHPVLVEVDVARGLPAWSIVGLASSAVAVAVVVARVRRWVRIGSITDVWVMNAMIRMGPWHVGHARGVDLEDLTRERRPPAGRLRRRQPWR